MAVPLIGYSLNNNGEKRGYTWEISNDGVGPARIESVALKLDGKPMRDWRQVFHALFGAADVPATYSQVYGKVVPPNANRETTIAAMHLLDLDQAKTFYAAQDRFDMTICYCSVYEQCWIARRHDPNVVEVPRCDPTAEQQFEKEM